MATTISTSPWIFPTDTTQPAVPSIVTYSGLSDTSQFDYGQQSGQPPRYLQQPPSTQRPNPTLVRLDSCAYTHYFLLKLAFVKSNGNLSYTEICEQFKEYKKWSEAQIVELTTQVSCTRCDKFNFILFCQS